VYCPRCGTPNEPGDRFCSSCGAALGETSGAPRKRRPARERLGQAIGTTRRARVVSAATVCAIVIAIAGFIALKPSGDSIPRDAYTIAADRLCVEAKRQIVAAERQSLSRSSAERSGDLARALVPIVTNWHSEFAALGVPQDRTDQVLALNTALQEAGIQIAALALAADRGVEKRTLEQARRVDATTADVEEATANLGLERCASQTIGFSRPNG
jgi:zinc-ribbon domain